VYHVQNHWKARPPCLGCRSSIILEPLVQRVGSTPLCLACQHLEMMSPVAAPIVRVSSSRDLQSNGEDWAIDGGCHSYKESRSCQLRPSISAIQPRKPLFQPWVGNLAATVLTRSLSVHQLQSYRINSLLELSMSHKCPHLVVLRQPKGPIH
jgi:hypothetical protein